MSRNSFINGSKAAAKFLSTPTAEPVEEIIVKHLEEETKTKDVKIKPEQFKLQLIIDLDVKEDLDILVSIANLSRIGYITSLIKQDIANNQEKITTFKDLFRK